MAGHDFGYGPYQTLNIHMFNNIVEECAASSPSLPSLLLGIFYACPMMKRAINFSIFDSIESFNKTNDSFVPVPVSVPICA